MRDGVKLFTSIYEPRTELAAGTSVPSTSHPILLRRTPYSCSPYGESEYPVILGPSTHFHDKGYVFVVQDVRGAYMSEGQFIDVRPHVPEKRSAKMIDESTDAFDTIAWLVANVPNNNGRVGMWGISYPGFYASAGMIDAHPALKAVSPQAPIADWWYDDFHHHGALFLPHAFNFIYGFGQPRPQPTKQRSGRIDHGTPDGYQFFLDLGPLSNVNARWYKNQVAFWNDVVAHPNYDEFWQARNLLPHLRHVAPAVMTVGGWFDAEDLYGALNTYRAIEAQNPGIYNVLVMGPWVHGGWARNDGDKLGHARFGSKTSLKYRTEMELAFFEKFLRDVEVAAPAEANVFDTGANEWRAFDAWPPKRAEKRLFWLDAAGALVADGPRTSGATHRAFVSDPNRPVPYTTAITTQMTKEYMTDDQRFAARRPDVLVYQTPKLDAGLTLAGPLTASLVVTTSGTDGDWIVKLIDVFPDDAPDPKGDDALAPGQRMGGYQMLVRSEVVRGRFRDDPSKPEPFTPGRLTEVDVPLQDVLHTFEPGHRLMIQVQCTWFPLVDRNPQTFVPNIYAAQASDFQPAHVAVWNASRLELNVLPR
jgi:putative CocE/NonD family hydrolase